VFNLIPVRINTIDVLFLNSRGSSNTDSNHDALGQPTLKIELLYTYFISMLTDRISNRGVRGTNPMIFAGSHTPGTTVSWTRLKIWMVFKYEAQVTGDDYE